MKSPSVRNHARTNVAGLLLIAAGLFFIALSSSFAQVAFDGSFGTGVPPSSLGGMKVVPYAPEIQSSLNASAATTSDAVIMANTGMQFIPTSSTFSAHGYTGAVWMIEPGSESVTLTLPSNVRMFLFYLASEGTSKSDVEVTAYSTRGEVASGEVTLAGMKAAQGFAFYCEQGTTLQRITITRNPESRLIFGELMTGIVTGVQGK